MKIGIIVAMDSEYESIKNILTNYCEVTRSSRKFLTGNYKKNELVICVGGIGKANAACTATLMIHSYGCSLIINSGCAGALTSDIAVGDIAVGFDYRYHDVWCPLTDTTRKGELQGVPYTIPFSKNILDKFDISKWNDHRIAHFFTGDQFIQTEETCDRILSDASGYIHSFPCICDMESMAIAQTCYQHNIDFMSVRVISDVPKLEKSKEDHMKKYENFWKTMSDKSYQFLKSFLDSDIDG